MEIQLTFAQVVLFELYWHYAPSAANFKTEHWQMMGAKIIEYWIFEDWQRMGAKKSRTFLFLKGAAVNASTTSKHLVDI